MKRFDVLYGNGKCLIREMPGKFPCDEDGIETKLVKAVQKYFGCEARQVGVPAKFIETDLPDDYELCGNCSFDHVYDGPGEECVKRG